VRGYRLADDVFTVPDDTALVVLHGPTETYLRLAGSARVVVEFLDAGDTLDDIVAALAEATGEEEEVVAADVGALVDDLVARGVLAARAEE
jgi:hypothetical protein